MQIDVRVDVEKAIRSLWVMQRDVNTAAAAALNRVGVTARAAAAREISKASGLPVNQVRKHVPLVRANKWNLQCEISARPYAPNLIRYSARQTKAGVSANAWRKRKVYRGTFIANKGRTVFKRVGPARLPIKAVYGPSVRREFIRDTVAKAINTTVEQRFALEFDRALTALLKRRR